MAPPRPLYVITSHVLDDREDIEGLHAPEVYDSKDAANQAAKKLMRRITRRIDDDIDRDAWDYDEVVDDEGLYRGTVDGGLGGHVAVYMSVFQVNLNKPSTRKTAKNMPQSDDTWAVPYGGDEDDDEEEDGDKEDELDEEEEEEEPEEPKKKAKPAPKKTKSNNIKAALNPSSRKTIPKGKPGCLADVKILFTGTFNTMDRVTSIATAKKYGADVVTKLEDTDYIVLGDRAGPKKLQVINELELETITEEEFFDILENGVSKEKRQRMENKRKADEEEEPERPAKAAKTGKGRAKKTK